MPQCVTEPKAYRFPCHAICHAIHAICMDILAGLDKKDHSTLSTVPTAATVRPVLVRCTNTHPRPLLLLARQLSHMARGKGSKGVRPESSSSWHEWILLLAGSRNQIGGLAGHVIRGPIASIVFTMCIWQFSSSSPRAAVSRRKQCLAGGPVACRVAAYCPCLLPNGAVVCIYVLR